MKLNKNTLFYILSFLFFCFITIIIFWHRVSSITSHYGMPDVDTDGGLWFQWYLVFSRQHDLPINFTHLVGYPFGYNIFSAPVMNHVYSLHAFILEKIMGFSWSNLIIVTNISSLIVYPLSSFGAMLLSYYLTKSFLAGLFYGFSHYYILMGRGQMSINHAEIIPYYILSLVVFLDKKSYRHLFISALIFSLLFGTDAYYAFFSGIFSFVILLLYPSRNNTSYNKLLTLVVYYSALSLILILMNLDFVLGNLYMFNRTQMVASGRSSSMLNELVSINTFFSASSESFLTKTLGPYGSIIKTIPLFVALFGGIFVKRKKTFQTLLLCFSISILLASNSQVFIFLNNLYFKYFGMFRGVSRIILLSALFFGQIVAMSLLSLFRKFRLDILKQRISIAVLSVIVVVSGLTTDPSWYKNTDFSRIWRAYQLIREDTQIKTVAFYPMNLNMVTWGFPSTYDLVGQIAHNKTLINGSSKDIPGSLDNYKKIKDIGNPDTIEILSKIGTDTIVLRNNTLDDSDTIIKKLLLDDRLTFVATVKGVLEEDYSSALEKSVDMTIFKIKKPDDLKPFAISTSDTYRNQNISPIIFWVTLSAVLVLIYISKNYQIKILCAK